MTLTYQKDHDIRGLHESHHIVIPHAIESAKNLFVNAPTISVADMSHAGHSLHSEYDDLIANCHPDAYDKETMSSHVSNFLVTEAALSPLTPRQLQIFRRELAEIMQPIENNDTEIVGVNVDTRMAMDHNVQRVHMH